MKKSELKQVIREEIYSELQEGAAGAAIGYLVGVLVDFFLKKKPAANSKIKQKSSEELEKELRTKLDQKYKTDSKFKDLVDAIAAGKKVI